MKQHWFLKNFFKMTQNIWSILKCLEHFEMAQKFFDYFEMFRTFRNGTKLSQLFWNIYKCFEYFEMAQKFFDYSEIFIYVCKHYEMLFQ